MISSNFRFYLSALLFFIFLSPATCTIRHVPAEYTTISTAVQASNPNDTVLLANGNYLEQVFFTHISLTIAGTFLLSNDTNDIPRVIITIPESVRNDSTHSRSIFRIHLCNHLTISGITFHDGLGTDYFNPVIRVGGAIFADSSNIAMDYCRITKSVAAGGGGMEIFTGNSQMTNCLIDSCSAIHSIGGNRDCGGGIHIMRGDSIIIHSCRFIGNFADWFGGGLVGDNYVYGELLDSYFTENNGVNGYGGAYCIEFNLIRNNFITNNTAEYCAGIGTSTDQTLRNFVRTFENNLITNNRALTSETGGAYFNTVDSTIWDIHDNQLINNSGLGAGAMTFQYGRHIVHRNLFDQNITNNPGIIGPIGGTAINARQNAIIYADSNIFLNNTPLAATFVSLGAVIHLTNCNFINNGLGVLQWVTSGSTAYNCYWGTPDGPRNTANRFSSGDSIGDSIGYVPWLTEPVNIPITSVGEHRPPFVPISDRLVMVAPNPFNSTTRITFSLPASSVVALDVFDITGRHIEQLIHNKMSAGSHSVLWNGSQVSSGMYFYRLQSGKSSYSGRLVLVK